MKHTTLLICLVISFSAWSQAGSYILDTPNRIKDKDAVGHYSELLVLNEDGTFTFDMYRRTDSYQPKEHQHGEGTWSLEKEKLIYFYAVESKDLGEKKTVNLNGSKARWVRKSPRDKSDKVVPEALRFYESNVFWMTGRNLVKQ